jgi:hypothetical protein
MSFGFDVILRSESSEEPVLSEVEGISVCSAAARQPYAFPLTTKKTPLPQKFIIR